VLKVLTVPTVLKVLVLTVAVNDMESARVK